ncbi:DDE-type integrase/transposase/recombinase [Nocardia vaccinii]|uniref:DDE-type integrase/transposase/recombinase n=1 Tax=Nocardia vaccinii TaxID=1822 RepID=UPI0008321B09
MKSIGVQVKRNFTAERENQLWCTDITEHRTGEGKVLLRGDRRILSTDRGLGHRLRPTASLVLAALDMAIAARSPDRTVVHSDHGTQFIS